MSPADHSHAPAMTSSNERKVLIAFFLTFTFMVIELAGGIWSGSLALIADAGHMLADAGALALAYAAFRFGKRIADTRRTFGYLRFEVLASLINSLTLFAIAGWVIYEAWQRVQSPYEILAGPMLLVAVGGLLINLLVLWILNRGENTHLNLQAASLHVLGDLLGSVGAVTAAILIYFTGWVILDPILSVLVSLLILNSAWRLASRSLHILLEGAPAHAAPDLIEQQLLQEIPELESVSHIHVWQITSGRTLATLHVRPKDNQQASTVARQAEAILMEHFDIEHATIAIDWNEGPDNHCSLSAPKTHHHSEDHHH